MLKTRLMKVQILLALGTILIASCGGGNVPEETPTAASIKSRRRPYPHFLRP